VDKAAVLLIRLAKNHPLPDGNRRSMGCGRMFVAINGWRWRTQPDRDAAATMVFAIAAGEVGEARTAEWLRQFPTHPAGA